MSSEFYRMFLLRTITRRAIAEDILVYGCPGNKTVCVISKNRVGRILFICVRKRKRLTLQQLSKKKNYHTGIFYMLESRDTISKTARMNNLPLFLS